MGKREGAKGVTFKESDRYLSKIFLGGENIVLVIKGPLRLVGNCECPAGGDCCSLIGESQIGGTIQETVDLKDKFDQIDPELLKDLEEEFA